MTDSIYKERREKDFLEISLPPFGAKITIVIGESGRDKALKAYKGIDIDRRIEYEVYTHSIFTKIGSSMPYLILIVMNEVFWPSAIAHEAYHAVCKLMRAIGDEPCQQNEEVVAYLVQYIVAEYQYHFFNITKRKLKV